MKTSIKIALKLWIGLCVAGAVIGGALPWFTEPGRQAAHTLAPFVAFIVVIVLAFWAGRASAKRALIWHHFDRGYTAGYVRAIREEGRAARERYRQLIEGPVQ